MHLKILKSTEAREHLQAIAWLRISVFQEWPYLYQGSLEYERAYLEHIFQSDLGLVVLAYDDGALIGVSTAIPLVDADHEIRAPTGDIQRSQFSLLHPQLGKRLGNRLSTPMAGYRCSL